MTRPDISARIEIAAQPLDRDLSFVFIAVRAAEDGHAGALSLKPPSH